MAWDAASNVDSVVRFTIQMIDAELSDEDKAQEAEQVANALQLFKQEASFNIGPIQATERGVEFIIAPRRVRALLVRLCTLLDERRRQYAIQIYLDDLILALPVRTGADLAANILAIEYLLPPNRTFLSTAITYAQTGGELTPAEQANLEWLRQRLTISPEQAAELQDKALGPYKTLQEKKQRYQKALTDEIARQYPLQPETQQLLAEFAENMGLPAEQALALYQEQVERIEAEAEVKRQQAEIAAEKARRVQAEQTQEVHHRQIEQTRDQQLNKYRAALRQVLEIDPDLADRFNQGRLEEARRLLSIADKEAQQLEAEVIAELYGSIDSAVGADYREVRQFLRLQQWKEADKATAMALITYFMDDRQPLDGDAFMAVPCQDLLTLDQLWSRYSNGRFGFKSQLQIFNEVNRQPLDFLQRIEWQGGLNIGNVNVMPIAFPYRDLQFKSNAPPGHLPTWRWCCQSLEDRYHVSEGMIESVFLHLEKCLPSMEVPFDSGLPSSSP